MTENVSKMCFIINFKTSKRHPHFLWALLDSSYPKHGYRHQNRDSSYARAQVIAKYVITLAAILNVSQNEVEGREKLNPNISGLFDP